MNIAIIIIILAFTWLLLESDFMRVRLPVAETIKEYDNRMLYNIKMEWTLNKIAEDLRYNRWLEKRYAPVIKICFQRDRETINPRDQWMQDEEDSSKRHNGEMIYQRGSVKWS